MQRHQPKRTFLKTLPKKTLRVQKKTKKKKKKEEAKEDFTTEVESDGEEKSVIVIDRHV